MPELWPGDAQHAVHAAGQPSGLTTIIRFAGSSGVLQHHRPAFEFCPTRTSQLGGFATLDSPAAFLASKGTTALACEQLNPSYIATAVVLEPAVTEATTFFNALVRQPLAPGAALSMKQKSLTHLDETSWQTQLGASATTAQALLRSEVEPGAQAFLAARPGGQTRMDTVLFVAELRHRPGIPEATENKGYPQCNGILDTLSLYSSACVAGGEKILRHTAVPVGGPGWTPT